MGHDNWFWLDKIFWNLLIFFKLTILLLFFWHLISFGSGSLWAFAGAVHERYEAQYRRLWRATCQNVWIPHGCQWSVIKLRVQTRTTTNATRKSDRRKSPNQSTSDDIFEDAYWISILDYIPRSSISLPAPLQHILTLHLLKHSSLLHKSLWVLWKKHVISFWRTRAL